MSRAELNKKALDIIVKEAEQDSITPEEYIKRKFLLGSLQRTGISSTHRFGVLSVDFIKKSITAKATFEKKGDADNYALIGTLRFSGQNQRVCIETDTNYEKRY